MDAIELIHRQISNLRRQANVTLQGTTDEQINWAPPGTANAIGPTLLHVITGEDMFIRSWMQHKPTLWEMAWSERIGLKDAPGGPAGWDEARAATFSFATLMEYQEAVCAETEAYLATLQPEDLDRDMELFGTPCKSADVFTILISHATGHYGEIAAVKGVQGGKGLPF